MHDRGEHTEGWAGAYGSYASGVGGVQRCMGGVGERYFVLGTPVGECARVKMV